MDAQSNQPLKTYEKPTLLEFGSLRTLTRNQANPTPNMDNVGNGKTN